MKKLLVTTLCIGLFLIPAFAGAAVLTFDDLTPTANYLPIPNGYGGLNWNNMAYLNGPSHAPNSGYNFGRVSGDYVAFNLNANMAIVSNGAFDFNGAYLTGAWNDDLNINVKGYLGATLLYDQTVVASATSPTWFLFNFLGVDKLEMTSFGGTPFNPGGAGAHFAMDNFTYNEAAVPEPSTMLLLGSGLVGLIGYGRKRLKK